MHLIYLYGLSKKGDKDKKGLLTSTRDQNQLIRILGEVVLRCLDEGLWDCETFGRGSVKFMWVSEWECVCVWVRETINYIK